MGRAVGDTARRAGLAGPALAAGAEVAQPLCAHCGLLAASGTYCCYGCELAAELQAEAGKDHASVKDALTLSLILSMAIMMLSLFLYAEDVYGPGAARELGWLRGAYRWASALLATPVVALLGVPLTRRALGRLRARQLSMELLVVSGALAAYALSLLALVRGGGGVYFDSATSALMLATLGRYLEATARSQASKLLGPSLALAGEPVLAGAGDLGAGEELVATAPALLRPGMRIQVLPERPVPVDAEVLARVEVNLAVLTGESAPVLLEVGDSVPAGALPLSGPLHGRVLRVARDSALERLAALARELRERPARVQRLADGFAALLTPLVWALALGTVALWGLRGPLDRAVITGLAVVLAACPCSYGVATPLVLWLALRKALQHGVLVRSGATLEQLAAVEVVAFDKTGTLTAPVGAVEVEVVGQGVTREEVLGLVHALDEGSRHPVARALVGLALQAEVAPARLRERALVIGGAKGRDEQGRALVLGAEASTSTSPSPSPSPSTSPSTSTSTSSGRVVLTRDGVVLARFVVAEAVRPEAVAAMRGLKTLGIRALILSGDAGSRTLPVAEALGIPGQAGLRAEDKLAEVQALGTRAAMVGDGMNDAPALAALGPSFAVAGASGLAGGVAQVTLLADDLRLVPWTIALARRALRLARRNLVWAGIYNLVFLGLAMAGALRPVWAGLSMLASSLLTVAGSLRLAGFAPPEQGAPSP